jgi:hypothetical protein
MQSFSYMARIDRQKHDIDVVERVMGYADERVRERDGRTEVIDVDVRPGIVGTTVSESEVIVGGLAPPDKPEE